MNRMMKRMERILRDCKELTGILKDEIKEVKNLNDNMQQSEFPNLPEINIHIPELDNPCSVDGLSEGIERISELFDEKCFFSHNQSYAFPHPESLSKSHSYDEKDTPEKPSIGMVPLPIWIDKRRQDIIRRLASETENNNGIDDVKVTELMFLTDMLENYNKVI